MAGDKVTEITTAEQFEEIISKDTPAIIDFNATWCPPCRAIAPKYHQLAANEDYSDIEFYSLDIDKVRAVALNAGIEAVPTFKVYKSGKAVNTIKGAQLTAITNALKAAKVNQS